MTTKETVEIIRESPLWQTLSVGEKMDAIVYAVESVEEMLARRTEEVDITDIIGEIFADYNS
jgi:hypothetical protein